MLTIAVFTALLLLAAIIVVLLRAQNYLRQHPELITSGTPLAYTRCHITLAQVIERYKEIRERISSDTLISWLAPNGRQYTIGNQGVEEQRTVPELGTYFLPWNQIGGVGVRMQPNFRLADENRDGLADSQYTIGFSFHLLIVPASGSTIDIQIPINGRMDAINFVAYIIAVAEFRGKRVNVFGFDRPPAPYKQKVSRI